MTQPLQRDLELAVSRVVSSGLFLRGKETVEFEEKWAEYCGQKYCVAMANGTDAITLIAIAANLQRLEVPAITCWYTAEGLSRGGCAVQPVDVDERGKLLNPSRDSMCVPLYGSEPSPDELRNCLYFDCAQAHGWKPPAQATAAWSFYPTKNLGALGDCGSVTTNDKNLADDIRILAGRDDLFVNKRQIVSRIDEIQAAVLKVKLPHLDSWIAMKQEVAAWYSENLSQSEKIRLVYDVHESRYYTLSVLCDRRNELMQFLKERGIISKVHYPTPIHQYDAVWSTAAVSLPCAEDWCDRVLSLPCFPGIKPDDVAYICDVIETFYLSK